MPVLYSSQKLAKRKLPTRLMLLWRLERMKVPTDEGVVCSIDANALLDQRKSAITVFGIKIDVNEGLGFKEHPDLDGGVILYTHIVAGDQLGFITHQADGLDKLPEV
jgi:hypothetical protein